MLEFFLYILLPVGQQQGFFFLNSIPSSGSKLLARAGGARL